MNKTLCCVVLFCVTGKYHTETVTSAQRAWDGIKKKGGELRERITFPLHFLFLFSFLFVRWFAGKGSKCNNECNTHCSESKTNVKDENNNSGC